MDLSVLLKPQALRITYLTYSSYKTPNFRPTDRPTSFGRNKQQRRRHAEHSVSCTGDDIHLLDNSRMNSAGTVKSVELNCASWLRNSGGQFGLRRRTFRISR